MIKWQRKGRHGSVGVTAANNIDALLKRCSIAIEQGFRGELPKTLWSLSHKPHLLAPMVSKRLWERLFQFLCQDADNEDAMLDSTALEKLGGRHKAEQKQR